MGYLCRLLLIIIVMLDCGCAYLVSDPRIEIRQTNLIGIDTSGADLELYLSVTNPNRFDLSLLGYTYDIRVMTLPLASGGLQQSVLFRAGSETDMRLPLRIKYADLVALLKRRPDPDRIPFDINARLQVRTFAGDMTIPVEKSSVFSVPQQYRPAFYLERFTDTLKQLSP